MLLLSNLHQLAGQPLFCGEANSQGIFNSSNREYPQISFRSSYYVRVPLQNNTGLAQTYPYAYATGKFYFVLHRIFLVTV